MMRRDNFNQNQPREFEEHVVQINRVSKKTKGGNKRGFSALVVVGNRQGKVGVALGKASDVASAIKKGWPKPKMIFMKFPKKEQPFPIGLLAGKERPE